MKRTDIHEATYTVVLRVLIYAIPFDESSLERSETANFGHETLRSRPPICLNSIDCLQNRITSSLTQSQPHLPTDMRENRSTTF